MIQPWFSEAKLGIFIHWGIYAVKPTGESWPFFLGEISHEDYLAQRHGFSASNYDPNAWADLFYRAGARYAVLTTKHHDGVALWDTQANDLSVVNATPAGRDLVGPYCDALREKGLKVGLYFSHLDWTHPDYATLPKVMPKDDHGAAATTNEFVYRGETDHAGWERFLHFHRAQLKELCTRFAPDLLWFDGDWDRTPEQWRMKELHDDLHTWRPGVILNSRMGGYGDYATPEQGLPTVTPAGPWEFCMTMNDHWGYMDTDNNYKSVAQLIWYLVECIALGGNLLLDIGPKADGTIPAEQVQRLEKLGEWIKPHAEAIYSTVAGLPHACCIHPSTLSKDHSVLYLFVLGAPQGKIAVKGIRNAIRSICMLDSGQALPHGKLGGAPWHDIPGVLWIDLPLTGMNPMGAVIKVELEGALNLGLSVGGAIEHNG